MTDRRSRPARTVGPRVRGALSAGVAVLLTVATLVGLVGTASPAGAATVVVPRGAVGVSVDYAENAVADYERWLGRQLDLVHVYMSGGSWDQLAEDAARKARGHRDTPERL